MFIPSSKIAILVACLLVSLNIAASQEIDLEQLTKKANDGELEAQLKLADYYYKGNQSKSPDYTRAVYWYQVLAEKGFAEAQLTLGLMYIKGQGVTKDDALAVKWLTSAAEQKLAPAQYLLGIAHEEGHGVKKDLIKAYMWYEVAAAVDNQYAIEARAKLNAQLDKQQIFQAETMATEWWLKFHH